MPVIGRLDKQVWDTLIEPIARRHEREAEEREGKEARREEEERAAAEEESQAK